MSEVLFPLVSADSFSAVSSVLLSVSVASRASLISFCSTVASSFEPVLSEPDISFVTTPFEALDAASIFASLIFATQVFAVIHSAPAQITAVTDLII